MILSTFWLHFAGENSEEDGLFSVRWFSLGGFGGAGATVVDIDVTDDTIVLLLGDWIICCCCCCLPPNRGIIIIIVLVAEPVLLVVVVVVVAGVWEWLLEVEDEIEELELNEEGLDEDCGIVVGISVCCNVLPSRQFV